MLQTTQSKIRVLLTSLLATALAITLYIYIVGLEQEYKQGDVRGYAFFAVREIPKGTSIVDVFNSGFVERREVLKTSIGTGAFESTSQGTEQSLFSKRDIPIGQIILINDFITSQVTTSGLLIPSGNVVVSIRLQDVERISPFLRPGNDVAVFATSNLSEISKTATKAIVPRAQVLGIGDSRTNADQGYIPVGDQTILTLAVESQYAAVLIQASKTMALHFALTPRETVISSDIVRQSDIVRVSP